MLYHHHLFVITWSKNILYSDEKHSETNVAISICHWNLNSLTVGGVKIYFQGSRPVRVHCHLHRKLLQRVQQPLKSLPETFDPGGSIVKGDSQQIMKCYTQIFFALSSLVPHPFIFFCTSRSVTCCMDKCTCTYVFKVIESLTFSCSPTFSYFVFNRYEVEWLENRVSWLEGEKRLCLFLGQYLFRFCLWWPEQVYKYTLH